VNNVNTGSTVNYASDDGAISVDVFTIANRDELIKEMEELEYVKTDSSETMDTYRKDGEMSLFNLIHYTVPGTNITGYTLLFNPFF
jgi:poly(3-hydroxyalkanoate) synthetase